MDSSNVICVHFGDRKQDIPLDPMSFSEYYLVAPATSEAAVIERASIVIDLPAVDLIAFALDQLIGPNSQRLRKLR